MTFGEFLENKSIIMLTKEKNVKIRMPRETKAPNTVLYRSFFF